MEEIQNLRKEAAAIKTLRSTLTESSGAAQRIFQKVYTEDISRLLLMEDMWKHRSPPHCLSWDELSKHDVEVTSATAEGAKAEASGSAGVNGSAGKIESQRELSLKDSFNLFISRLVLVDFLFYFNIRAQLTNFLLFLFSKIVSKDYQLELILILL